MWIYPFNLLQIGFIFFGAKYMLEVTKARRLAFIKYLVQVGINQSNLPEPANGSSLLTFHDATELFLQLASEHLDVGKPQPGFIKYWEVISPRLKECDLPQKESMRRLNKARVSLKHHGILPSKLDVEAFRSTTVGFFEEATPMVFDLSFSEISLSDFVDPEEAKSHLKESEKLLSQGNTEASIDQASIAFRILLEDYEGKKSVRYGRSPFFFGQDLTFLDSFYMDLGYNGKGLVATPQFQEKLGDFIDKVKESLEAIQNAIRILAMGIDYPRYSRFDLLTPQVLKSREGEHIVEREYRGPRIQGDEEDAQFCINFVIETALKLQEFDYSINKKKNDDPLTPH